MHPEPVDDGGADHLQRGLAMPGLELPATAGPAIRLSELSGWTVLFVYTWSGRPGFPNPPGWDDIPGAHGSTPEAKGFRNLHSAFAEHGVRVFGLSVQPTAWQRDFSERLGLPFVLLSDSERTLQRALGLPTFSTGGVTYLKRLTLVLKDGRIERTFYPVHPPQAHPRELLAWLDELVTRKPRG